MMYALLYALCSTLYAMLYALCSMLYALCSMLYALLVVIVIFLDIVIFLNGHCISSSQDENRTNSQSFKNLEENVAIVSPSVAISALVWIYQF